MSNDRALRQEVIQQVKSLSADQLQKVLRFVKSINASDRRSIEEKIDERVANVPDEAWEEVLADASENLDHYVYGAPKQ